MVQLHLGHKTIGMESQDHHRHLTWNTQPKRWRWQWFPVSLVNWWIKVGLTSVSRNGRSTNTEKCLPIMPLDNFEFLIPTNYFCSTLHNRNFRIETFHLTKRWSIAHLTKMQPYFHQTCGRARCSTCHGTENHRPMPRSITIVPISCCWSENVFPLLFLHDGIGPGHWSSKFSTWSSSRWTTFSALEGEGRGSLKGSERGGTRKEGEAFIRRRSSTQTQVGCCSTWRSLSRSTFTWEQLLEKRERERVGDSSSL